MREVWKGTKRQGRLGRRCLLRALLWGQLSVTGCLEEKINMPTN